MSKIRVKGRTPGNARQTAATTKASAKPGSAAPVPPRPEVKRKIQAVLKRLHPMD